MYRKFSDRKNEFQNGPSAKVAKVAKVPENASVSAGNALAGSPLKFAKAPGGDRKNEFQNGPSAKVAKVAKVPENASVSAGFGLASGLLKFAKDRGGAAPGAATSRARLVHRIWASRFPDNPDQEAETLVAEARRHGAVLVADGPELIVCEDRAKLLPAELFGRIARHAGAIIAVLRAGHTRRIEDGRVWAFAFDPPRRGSSMGRAGPRMTRVS